MGSAPLWTSGGLWLPSSSSYVLALLVILFPILFIVFLPVLFIIFSPVLFVIFLPVLLPVLFVILLSILFVVIILLVWWLWGLIHSPGVHSFAGGLVIWWSCCPVLCYRGGHIVGVGCCASCIVMVVVGLSLSWLDCRCRGWVVVVMVELSWWWLCCGGGGGCTVVVMVSWLSLCTRLAWLFIIPPIWCFLVVVSSMAGALLSLFAMPALSCPCPDAFPTLGLSAKVLM